MPRPISTMKERDLVVVIYEEEKFTGKVEIVENGQAVVPLSINTLQDFEADTVYSETVYYPSIMPQLLKIGRGWKWSY